MPVSERLGMCESLHGDVPHIHITEGLNPCVNWRAEPSRGAPEALPNIHDRLVMGWLVSNAKTPDEVKWASYPIGMVQRWVERAQEAEAKIGCVAPIPYAASGHVVLLEALRRIDECVNDTTVAWESRLYQIKRYTEKAIKEAECRQK